MDYLLDAANQVDAPIVILGDGPESKRLQQEAQHSRLSNVQFLGALNDADKHAILTLCRAIVFPSHLRSEAFGMTLLEGAQAAKPLICCEINTGTTWINRDGETGLVVPPEDSGALAQAMNTLANDDGLCTRLGDGARKRWLTHFSPPVVGQAYRAVYDELLSSKG